VAVAVTSAAAAAAAVTVTAAAAAVTATDTYERGCTGVLFVEDVECRQANVRDFLFTESDFVTQYRPNGYCGCAARQRQRQPGGPQQRHGACSTLPLRSLFRVRHGGVLHTFAQVFDFSNAWYARRFQRAG
jgi:hypothetical protein